MAPSSDSCRVWPLPRRSPLVICQSSQRLPSLTAAVFSSLNTDYTGAGGGGIGFVLSDERNFTCLSIGWDGKTQRGKTNAVFTRLNFIKPLRKPNRPFASHAGLAGTLNPQLSTAFARCTAFTCQGRLNNGTNPVTGSYDLAFTLSNTNNTGAIIAGPVGSIATPVTNGLFTATIDFGAGVFTGSSNWLEIAVRTKGMAQDFYAAFGLGADDKHIAVVDESGVALAAIQGLNQKLNEKDAEIQDLKVRLEKPEQLIIAKNGGGK